MHKKIDDKIVLASVVIIVVLVASYFTFKNPPRSMYTNSNTKTPYTNTPKGSTSVKTTSTSSTSSHSTYYVNIENFNFNKASISIKTGDTVVWTNKDSTAHTVTGLKSMGPNSGALAPGQSYKYTYTSPGAWTYACHYHPSMTGVVYVQ